MAATTTGKKKEGDPLKLFTLVMALLVVVMAVLWFVIDGRREDFAMANVGLERMMGFQGGSRDPERAPASIPDLAWEVESLANAYNQASGGGGLDRSIPREMMDAVASTARLKQSYGSGERRVKGGGGSYETISQNFEYKSESDDPPEIWRLLRLVWEVESRGRFRVSELTWQVADKKDNSAPPFDRIKNPQIRVSLRVPVLE